MEALIAMHAMLASSGGSMASLTIRGLDEALKGRLRLEAARQGYSMEEAARQILRRALMSPELEAGGLGSRVHGYFVEAGAFDLEIPGSSLPRTAPALA
jgi:plasmid stability protein